MGKISWTLTIFFLAILLPGICIAQNFKEDGYKISMKWRQSSDRFMVKGAIKGGKVCKNLKLSLDFKNLGDSTAQAHVETPISYHNTSGEKFYAKGKVDLSSQYKNKWVVDNINFECF